MSILWCGGEDIDFPNMANTHNTTSTYFRTIARTAIYAPYGSYSNTFPGGAVTSCWLSFRTYLSNTASNMLLVGLKKYGSSNSLVVYITATDEYPSIGKYNGTTLTNLVSATVSPGISSILKMDLEVINFGATATLNLYVDGSLYCTYSGDPRPSGMNDMDCVSVWGSSSWFMSEIIVADEDTRLMSLVTHYPSAAGDTNDWTGAYTDVDETTISDTDLIYTADADDVFQCNLRDLPTGTFSVRAVNIVSRATRGASGIQTLKTGIKSGGSVDVDSGQTVGTYWNTYLRLMQTNPITAAAFTPAEINALQVNLRSAS